MDSMTKTRQTRQTPTNGGIVGPKNPTNPTTPYRGVGLSGGVADTRCGGDLSDCRPTKKKTMGCSQAGLRPVAPVGATLNDEQIAALLAAGRLLQSKSWPGGRQKIERADGEAYPEAVRRVIAGLPPDERDHLRELVVWVRSYERESGKIERRQPQRAEGPPARPSAQPSPTGPAPTAPRASKSDSDTLRLARLGSHSELFG